MLNVLTLDVSIFIDSSKLKYQLRFANKLSDLKAALKTCWKILETFLTLFSQFLISVTHENVRNRNGKWV